MSTAENGIIVSSPSNKKWYEDEDKQTEFSRAGVGFDAISVKMQELYEIGVLKLFIESEILKSNTGAFERGFKELYNPYSMTVPQRVGKDLLFTSDIEFSESGFAPGSLENDKKKIFLNQNEFTNYLLRLPKPISDTTATPLDEKQDSNAYKYLQVLGDELQDKIAFLCDNFIQGYNRQYKQNANDILRIQKDINDLKRLVGTTVTSDDVQKRIADKEKELVQVKNIKIQLEAKRANYKSACAILSNSTRRSQYNASLVAAYPAIKNDASSHSTVMIDWFKLKQNGSDFFKQVCQMFKPMIPKEMMTKRQEILIAIQEVATKLGATFKPIFETFFFNELRALMIPNNQDDINYFRNLNNKDTREAEPLQYSWTNVDAKFQKILSDTTFTNYFYKTELERLQSIAKFMANFDSEILTLFSLFKFEKNLNIFTRNPGDNRNVFERAEQDDDFFKRPENVNMLFQNVFYLKNILEMIKDRLDSVLGPLTPQQIADKDDLVKKINEIVTIADNLIPKLNEYQVRVQRYDYDTLLGSPSQSGFVESAFNGKVFFISHFHKNNKFLVSSELIQNGPVTITIPDGNYTPESLSSVIESELCGTCKWTRKSDYEANMLWRCKYDANNFLQLRLYFPYDNIPDIPNISLGKNYTFTIASRRTNMTGVINLNIPEGEYKNVSEVLDAMQKTINDVIKKQSESVTTPFRSTCKITLEVDPAGIQHVLFNLDSPLLRFKREILRITLSNELSDFLCQGSDTIIDINNRNISQRLLQPPGDLRVPLSKTITIVTRTKIDGEVYDASEIFGITQRTVNDSSIQFFPDITVNALQVSDNSNVRRNCARDIMNHNNFDPCIFLNEIIALPMTNALMDFGILNFTSKRINDELEFKAVDLKEVEKRRASIITTKNVFKTEILEKTGVYMNNRLLEPKVVPVITPVDILNSILYRYPCIPSPSPVKRELVEGSVEFDEFIQERVNVPEFNAVVCLGKGEKDQMPSLTLKNVLKKTLMYDESDARRNKLLCDLHYAICGPVYVDTNPSREINRLTMIDQFTLQNNRPNVVPPGPLTPPPLNPPFSVKGITPFYDYDKEYYKYLIYGECTVEMDTGSYTKGCIKYYDPGEKIGTGHVLNASELYDVIQTVSFEYDQATGSFVTVGGAYVPFSSTINKVVWLPNDTPQTYDKFIIVGDFQDIIYQDKYEDRNDVTNIIEYNRFNDDGTNQNYTIWKFSHEYPTEPSPPHHSYFESDRTIDNTNVTRNLRISNIFSKLNGTTIQFSIVIRTDSQGRTLIFLPIDERNSNQIPNDTDSTRTDVFYKLSCSAVSMNKTLKNAYNSMRFYTIMQNNYPNTDPKYAYATSEINNYLNKIDNLIDQAVNPNVNPNISDHLLWLGLKEKTKVREILSCKHINGQLLTTVDLELPIKFEDGDSIENIRVDINDPEIVTVFGKFTATVSENARPNKVIRNAMVIYTNLQNDVQNDTTFGTAATYSLGYDNFKGTTVNEDPMFTSFYCVDGLIPASIDKGTMQQNIGILMMKKKIAAIETTEVSIVGFHNDKLTTISVSDIKEGTIPSTPLCYDYNMCADTLKINDVPTTEKENGVFNPLTFYAFYLENANVDKAANVIALNTSLSKGVYSLIHARNPTRLFSSPSNLHVLNTWGIDLSSNQTLFYKRMYEPSKTTSRTLNFNIKTYEKYMNDIVDTILSSAKAYYEEKIKSTFYDYGFIDGKPPILFKRNSDTKRNVAVVVGGGKEEDAKQMLFATEAVIEDELANSDKKNRKNIEFKKFIEIRIPDMMMSEEYLSAITLSERKNARIIFVNSIFKYSKQLFAVTTKQNEKLKNNRTGNNVTVIDEYQVVLCSKNETIRDYFSELKTNDDDATLLTLSDDVFDFELPSSSPQLQHDKHVIIVNEWNDKGFIGDYGAYAYSDANALTPNQLMISKTRQIVTEATAVKEATIKSVPKYPNTAFLLNPVFSYHTLDPSKWVGFNSLFEKYSEQGEQGERGIQVGGVPPLYPALYSGYQDPLFMNSQLQALYPQQQQLGMLGPRGYGYGYGYGYGDNDNEVIKMKRKVLESTDVPSKNMRKINFQTMQTDVSFKKIVLWLFDSRENKMLMTKTLIGNNKVVLSLPVQSQQVGSSIRASGYSLLQQLCRRLFNQAEITRRWTLEVSYAYEEDPSSSTVAGKGRTGIFIYSAKSFDLPKPTAELNYVNMQAVLNLTKGAIIIKKGSQRQLNGNDDGEKGNGTQLEVNSRDVALIDEVFRVVPLIQGGIISSTSKEFNEIVAGLISKTPHQHLRSSISEKKRKDNVEKNVNFLINLFFPQNSLFFVRGQNKYYIYSAQRNCKIFTIVKQTGYDDDSYLTCLKLFLQSEYDYKQKLSTFRVGCSVKKKLIADNFSSVWDSFWNDLIESEQQASNIKQIENDIENTDADQGEGDVNAPEDEGGDDQSSAPTCLSSALTTCKKMYALHEDWNASNYYPLAYDGIFYNLDPDNPDQHFGFNNEYYYKLDKLETNEAGNTFFGFKCMKYNGDSRNPILYLGGRLITSSSLTSAVFELNLKTKKIRPMLLAADEGDEILCIDMIGNKHLLIGGKFNNVIKYIDGRAITERTYSSAVPLIIMNTETHEITNLYSTIAPKVIPNPPVETKVNKICICKNRKVINQNDKTIYHEYVGLFGGNIQIDTAGTGPSSNIFNIGCVVIQIPINESNPLLAKMCSIDSYVERSTGFVRGLALLPYKADENINITSIVCDEEEESSVSKNKTTFYIGGYFNTFGYMDYEKFEKAKADAAATGVASVNSNDFIKNGNCNSILKLSITTTYVNPSYQNQCIFEPIETNTNKNNVVFHASLALHEANSKKYLLAFTAHFDKNENPISINDSSVTTTLNVFNLKSRVNAQIEIPIPKLVAIIKKNYVGQCFTVVKDVQSKKNIAVMNYTVKSGTDIYGYSFTCELNMESQAPLRVVESACNDEKDKEVTSKNNSVTDVCGIENKNGNQIDIYVARENVPVSLEQILYPLTVKSNYQQIGSWNMAATTTVNQSNASEASGESETFFRFVDSMIELNKVYKEYPSSMLFLQSVDYRDKNEKITKTELQKMYDELMSNTRFSSDDVLNPKVIETEKSCNNVFSKLSVMLKIWSSLDDIPATATDPEINIQLFNKIKTFYDNLIFLLIYAGCITLAQLLCKNYTTCVLSYANRNAGDPDSIVFLTKNNVKSKFMMIFTTVGFGGEQNINNHFIKMFSEKAQLLQLFDNTFPYIIICSNSDTHTGIAYIMRGFNKQLVMISGEAKQKALQNKIYKSNETFFNENREFFTTAMASDSINTIDQISFCSFYKFQRDNSVGPFRTNVGGMIDKTIYASVNVDSSVKIDSSKVLDFLRVIIDYFKRLPRSPVIDTGISGPVARIIFGGDFGCNLLHDTGVCSQFSKHGMKIYTMPNNSNAFTDAKNVSGNQMFVVDVNVTSSSFSPLSVGGGNDVKQRRLKIGEPIQSNYSYIDVDKNKNMKLIIVNHKKKTRRRYK